MGMQPMSSGDVRNYCIQNRLAHKCGPGTKYDDDTQMCAPKRSVCPSGYKMDAVKGTCAPLGESPATEETRVRTLSCGMGTIYDGSTNTCQVDCGDDSTWNERTHQCERPCREGSIEHTICGPIDKEISSCAFK